MRNTFFIALLATVLAHSGFALASDHGHMNQGAMSAMHATLSHGHMGVGMVNRINMQHHKINLTHGPIKSLGWAGMTMDFVVKDTAILKHVKAGQKVSFEVLKEGPGKYFVVKITPLR